MKIIITTLTLMVCCIGFGNAQQKIPAGLQKIIDDYVKDSTAALGFDYAQRTLEIKFNDIRLGIPIEVYALDREKLENLSDTVSVGAFIIPSHWEIPIYVKDRCIYTITVKYRGQKWILTGSESGGSSEVWENLRSAWPEDKGDYFIIIVWGGSRMLHFPQKSGHNLTFIPGYDNDSPFVTNDLTVLGDSRKVLSHLKESLKERKKWLRDHPEPMN